MFHVFVLAYPPPPDDVTFGKWPFEKMSGGLGKNFESLPRSWDLEEFRASLLASIETQKNSELSSYILWAPGLGKIPSFRAQKNLELLYIMPL